MKSSHTAIIPVPRTDPANWLARHEGFVREAQRGGINVLFIGDSIVDGWRNTGLAVWNKYYAPRRAANFGIDGDRTQHVLWRMDHGENIPGPGFAAWRDRERPSDRSRGDHIGDHRHGVTEDLFALHAQMPDGAGR